MTNGTYILALDPGGTTGWCLAKYSGTEPLTFIDGGQIPNGVAGLSDFIWHVQLGSLGLSQSQIIWVSESFVLDGRTKFPDLTSVRIEGALTALLGEGTVVYQRNTAKSAAGDEGLKRLGFWLPGQRHQNDARLHALAWAKKNHPPTQAAYWPEHGD